MPELAENSVDSIVCDPPYHLKMSKKGSSGFMGKKWDGGDVAFHPETWAKAMHVLKPGGYLLAFGGTRTYHRLVCAIEDAGFKIYDCVAWITGQGFPKNHNISKAIDQEAGAEREVVGQKIRGDVEKAKTSGVTMAAADANKNNKDIFGYGVEDMTVPSTNEAKQWDGWGTALKPSMELIVVARKPISERTVASNVLKRGTGGLNIDGCRIEGEAIPINKLEKWSGFGQEVRPDYTPTINTQGRWPANVIHDGSDEVLKAFAVAGNRVSKRIEKPSDCSVEGNTSFDSMRGNRPARGYDDSGSAARFFYCAKANRTDRDEGCENLPNRNGHNTVKPTDLMRYLCRLVTPPNGTILDPFAGSGSTGKAALYEGFNFIGIEGEQEYCAIAKARMQFVMENDSPLLRSKLV
jgi:site-specific DNA-methyltransferase (adenine-specific)